MSQFEDTVRIRSQEIDSLPDLMNLIKWRLTGVPTVLPPLHRDEEPVDVFVDLAELDPRWRDDLQTAVAKLLATEVANVGLEDPSRSHLLGELCYLAARIGSEEALDSLRSLVASERATGLIGPGEDLRLRALRAFVGLLGTAGRMQTNDDRNVLTAALAEPRLAMVALAGLIGLWPDEAETFLRVVSADIQYGELLELSIRLAFPTKNPLR